MCRNPPHPLDATMTNTPLITTVLSTARLTKLINEVERALCSFPGNHRSEDIDHVTAFTT